MASSPRSVANTLHILGGILAVLFCTSGIIAVAYLSDGSLLDHWPIRPVVVMSLLSSILNPILSYLVLCGIRVTWWREALRGTTLAQLHFIWAANRPLHYRPYKWHQVGFNWRLIKLVFGAIFITATALAVHPMLQQAVESQSYRDFESSATVTVDMLETIPDSLIAGIPNGTTYAYTAAAVDAWSAATIRTKDEARYACPSNATCRAVAHTTGISVRCSATRERIAEAHRSPVDREILNITAVKDVNGELDPNLRLSILYLDSADPSTCEISITTEICSIFAAKASYPIEIVGNEIKIVPRSASEWNSTDILRWNPSNGPYRGVIDGLSYQLNHYFRSMTVLRGNRSAASNVGILSETLFRYSPATVTPRGTICVGYYERPTDFILNKRENRSFA
jgi:hypothetical protein